jgi:hypothetical protein
MGKEITAQFTLDEKVKQRLAGRAWFAEVAATSDCPFWLDGFAKAAREWADKQLGTAPDALLVMTDQQAKAFEGRKVGFGEFAELTYGEAPIDRLAWYGDACVELQAYLRSARGQRRIDGD